MASLVVLVTVGLGLAIGFLSGLNASGSLAATMICSGAVGPRKALLVVAAAQLLGALTVGVAVAYTVGQGIVGSAAVTAPVVVAALCGTIAWGALSWYLGVPSSSSHALIGALVGAAWWRSGLQAISLPGIGAVLLVLFVAPWLGYIASYLLMSLLLKLFEHASMRTGARLRRAQWLLAPLMAAGHGANDAQKVMGIVAMGLLSLGVLPSFYIPPWLQLAAALSLAMGTGIGGMRIIRTVGLKLYRIRPIHGFAAQAAAALVVLGASVLGGPVSSTQVISASVAGAGSAQRLSQVRWGVVSSIVMTWLLTIPGAGVLGVLACMATTRWL